MFKEGYIRTTSLPYKLNQDTINRPEIHLTNNAVQMKFEDYGKHENGNQLSFDQLDEYLVNYGGDECPKNYVRDVLVPEMKSQIGTTMESIKSTLKMSKGCFDLLGYDFIIDAEFQTYLIEVNTNPCLDESSPLLQ
jgi:hypothetical protein